MITKTNLFIIALLYLSIVNLYADTNGVWHYAEDVRPGTFGADEGFGPWLFNGTLSFLKPIYVMAKSFFSDAVEINVTSGKALTVRASSDDAIYGETNGTGKSAIHGVSDNQNGYSGYFEGGRFYVQSENADFSGTLNAKNITKNGREVATIEDIKNNENSSSFKHFTYSTSGYGTTRTIGNYSECWSGGNYIYFRNDLNWAKCNVFYDSSQKLWKIRYGCNRGRGCHVTCWVYCK